MKELIRFIYVNCVFLFEDYNFKFTNSLTSKVFGDNSFIEVENEVLKLRFIKDRDQIFLDFIIGKNYYSFDVVLCLFDDYKFDALLDENKLNILKDNFQEIMLSFSKEELSQTLSKLKVIEKNH